MPPRIATPTAPKKKVPPAPNAFAAVDPLSTPLPPAAGFAAGTSQRRHAQAERERKAQEARIKRVNDAIFKARQGQARLHDAAQTAASNAGLLPKTTTPFGGGKPGARDTYVPDLSAKVTLAHASQARVAQGGLLTKKQLAAEALAKAEVESSRKLRLSDKDQLPAQLTQLQPSKASSRPLPSAPTRPEPQRPAETPRSPRAAALAAYDKTADDQSLLPSFSLPDHWKGVIARAAGNLGPLGTVASMAIQGEDTSRQAQALSQAVKPAIGAIPTGVAVSQADLTPAARKRLKEQGTVGPVPLAQLIEMFGEGALGPQFRKQLIEQAHTKQGWNIEDADTWSDADAAARAFNPYKHTAFGFVQNAASDVGALMAGANIAPMVGGAAVSAAEGNPHDLVRLVAEFGDQWRKHLIGFGDRPILENFYSQPFTTWTSNAPFFKAAGGFAGKRIGLAPTREVTLPTTGHTVEVPATQNALTRPLTKLSDAVLARSVHPDVRAQETPTGSRTFGTERSLPGRAAAAAGRGIEKRHVEAEGKLHATGSRLAKGSEARRAQEDYLRAVRRLPLARQDIADLIPGRVKRIEGEAPGDKGAKITSKQQRAESLVRHSAIGLSSDKAVTYYENLARDSDEAAAKADVAARASSEAGDTATATKERSAADKLRRMAREQRVQAEYSRRNPVDLGNLHPKEQELIDAAREVSAVATRLKQENHSLGEQGTLYGDLQHNLHMVADLEPDTHAGQLAREILTHRENLDVLERVTGSLADRRSPAAQSALGRAKALSSALDDIKERQRSVKARRKRAGETITRQANRPVTVSTHASAQEAEAAAQRHRAENPDHEVSTRAKKDGRVEVRAKPPQAGSEDAAAARAGIAAGTIKRITDEGKSALRAKRERHGIRVTAEKRIAAEMEASQRGAHEKVARADVRRAEQRLQQARHASLSPVKSVAKKGADDVVRLEQQVTMFKTALEHFVPDERLTAQHAKVAKLEAENLSIELSPGETSAIAQRHISAAQERAIGKVALHDAIHEGEYKGASRELDRLAARLQAEHDEAAGKYEAVSGSKAEAAARHEEESAAFVEKMRAFQAHQHDQGVDPYHIALRRPGDKVRPGVERTENQQFPSGNYTADIHIQLSADLEAEARVAVENELFRRVSQTPYVIHDPPPESRVPPGFILTDAEALKTPRKPVYGANENEDLISSWQTERQAPHEFVPDDGKKYALVAKDMQEWISSTVRGQKGDLGPIVDRLLQFTNAYRRWMLFSLPRTLVNNAVGNPILATLSGAGIADYIRAIHILRNHPDEIPTTMRHMGPIHNALESAKLTGWQSFWRNANVFHEDLGRLTTYMHHAIRAGKREEGLKFYRRVDIGSEFMTRYLKDLASGKNPDVHKFMDEANRWFGDMTKKGKYDPVFSTAFLFHRWVGHMVHLTLWTMPKRYPGRTALLLNLSRMADEYRKKHGVQPDWAKSIVGLFTKNDLVQGATQKVMWGVNTGGFNPFATPGQTFDLGSSANEKSPIASLVAANLTPMLRIPLEQGLGRRLDTLEQFKDEYGNPLHPGDYGLLGQQVIANTPILSTIFPRTGLADNQIQFDPNAARRYSAAGAANPEFYPPTPMGHGIWIDLALRALAASGASIRPVDVGAGPRTTLSANKTVSYQARTAKTASAHKRKVELAKQLKANQALWSKQRPGG